MQTVDGEGTGAPRQAKGEWERLVRLFAGASPVTMSHWNPMTGETFEAPRGKQRQTTAERFEERLWREPDWVEVPWQESDVAHAMAAAFADHLQPGRGKSELMAALDGPKPFRAWRAVLLRHPGLKRRWQRIVEAEAAERLVTFCLGLGLTLDDPRFAQLAAELAQAEPETPTVVVPAAVRRPARALSIGRPAGVDDADDDE